MSISCPGHLAFDKEHCEEAQEIMVSRIARVQAVVFDWAGTTVDYGCFAPVDALIKVFQASGIVVTVDEARGPMGLSKREHIRAVCGLREVSQQWKSKFNRSPSIQDLDKLHAAFEHEIVKVIPSYGNPIPDALDVILDLRSKGIKIGSTTGYTTEMTRALARTAARKGYVPDAIVSSSDVPAGRPLPWMCYQNAIDLDVYPLSSMVKVGDTIHDIKEGLNAGMWSIGVIQGGSILGLTEQEVKLADPDILRLKSASIREELKEAGAHFVVDSISELGEVIAKVDEYLRGGVCPHCIS